MPVYVIAQKLASLPQQSAQGILCGQIMEAPRTDDVTTLLMEWQRGDAAALERLLPLVYADLRKVARAHLRREQPGHSLQPTALVHEVYLRLVGLERLRVESRTHFLALAARLMRQILVD